MGKSGSIMWRRSDGRLRLHAGGHNLGADFLQRSFGQERSACRQLSQ